ncbi:hypothetical protein HBI56_083150 [Parastagonospora nodorum]|uniref:Uncharacterized protein n=1 Tax=Phaeosphaeria nodorum (strain SN15 / ATCC MYA-4574 / FGSC 10173) TaxID=321614 RepID=A0A7U2FG25_PHANO|nr:hypothetical protein HBH56_103420 [Parastagonospora nodorum]QRD04606.1 hypothetical protein JI435_105430 [Parastagonospora nodorum SN15]KAH3929361.1 hypothetical protein HBH54_126990 [Parastagonospora nodorum]KAH3951605.1 hypothetical protein HBH53_061010 [Parastagonospora nodorum]KAH3975718.1 hypothetical protein HBH52_125840 [Parastagonospora nodorum]
MLHPRMGKEVLTNHFQVSVLPVAILYEYRITGISPNEKRATKRRYIETAIQNTSFLRDNRKSFATDYFDTIISWVDLHSLGAGPKVGAYDESITDSADERRLIDVVDRDVTSHLNLRLSAPMDLAAFRSCVGSSHDNPAAYNPERTRANL